MSAAVKRIRSFVGGLRLLVREGLVSRHNVRAMWRQSKPGWHLGFSDGDLIAGEVDAAFAAEMDAFLDALEERESSRV
jgi:hypothetical protein